MGGITSLNNGCKLQGVICKNQVVTEIQRQDFFPVGEFAKSNLFVRIYYNGTIVANAILPATAKRITGVADLYVADLFSFPSDMTIEQLQIKPANEAQHLPSEFFTSRRLASFAHVGSVNLSSSYSLQFSFKIDQLKESMLNLLHVTQTGNDDGSVGSRAPSIWLMSNSNASVLFIESNEKSNEWNLTSTLIPLNKWTNVVLISNQTTVSLYVNGLWVASRTSMLIAQSKKQIYLGYSGVQSDITISGLFIQSIDPSIPLTRYLDSTIRYPGSYIDSNGQNALKSQKFILDFRAITPASSISPSQLITFLDFNLGRLATLEKRQFFSVSKTSSLLSYYLSLCPLNSISSNSIGNNQILAGCLAGVTQMCQSNDFDQCEAYWTSIYRYSVYESISTCLPWNSGASSDSCASAINDFCKENTLYQCSFAKTSKSKLFKSPIYIPCDSKKSKCKY